MYSTMAYIENCTFFVCEFISQNQKNLLTNKAYIHTTYIYKHCIIYWKDQLTLQIKKNNIDFSLILRTFWGFQHQCKIDVKVCMKRSWLPPFHIHFLFMRSSVWYIWIYMLLYNLLESQIIGRSINFDGQSPVLKQTFQPMVQLSSFFQKIMKFSFWGSDYLIQGT